MKFYLHYVFILFVGLLLGCEPEFVEITETISELPETIELISADINGLASDLNGNPISNAQVDIKVDDVSFATAFSLADGRFSFFNEMVNQDLTVLKLTHPDYADSYDVGFYKEGIDHFVDVKMKAAVTSRYGANENITYEDELISLSISPDILEGAQEADISLKTSASLKEEIRGSNLLPKIGSDDTGNDVFLNHVKSFHIGLFKDGTEKIELIDGESITVSFKDALNISDQSLWRFDVKTARWIAGEDLNIIDDNSIAIDKTGQYSIATSSEIFTLMGNVVDDNNGVLVAAKVELFDESGFLIDRALTNGLGEFLLLSRADAAGNIEISKEGFESIFLDVNNINEFVANDIKLSIPAMLQCEDIILATSIGICDFNVTPNMLVGSSANGITDFQLQYNNTTGTSEGEELPFEGFDWGKLIGSSGEYTISFKDDSGLDKSCMGLLSIIDETPPSAVCHQNLSASFDGKSTIKIFAESIDNGSHDFGCDSELDFKIARMDMCSGSCTDGDFAASLEFSDTSLNQDITIILRVTDSSGNFNDCFTILTIIE